MGKVADMVRDRLARRETDAEGLRHAVLDWWDASALEQAAAIDARGSEGKSLAGMTISVKANVDVSGARTTGASRALADCAPASADAPIIAELRKAGAIFLAQTNMVEFAYGALGTNPNFGTPVTPLFPGEGRLPGGSSSGAGVTVALGLVDAAVGSDTSGSVRIPAACCGVAAFKPTQGRYSNDGIIPLTPSLDTAGFIAPDIATCARLDAAVVGAKVAPPATLEGRRFLVPRGFIKAIGCDEKIMAAFESALARLRKHGAMIEDVDMRYLVDIGEATRAGGIVAAEAYLWHADLVAERAALYDPRIAPRIAAGADVTAVAYLRARKRLDDLAARFATDMDDAVAILTPAIPAPPPRMDDITDDQSYLALNLQILRFTEIANRINVPSLNMPIDGGVGAASLLLTGSNGDDYRVLAVGQAVDAVVNGEAQQ